MPLVASWFVWTPLVAGGNLEVELSAPILVGEKVTHGSGPEKSHKSEAHIVYEVC